MNTLTIQTYDSEELKKIWAGYIDGPNWTVFFSADGGVPVVIETEENEQGDASAS